MDTRKLAAALVKTKIATPEQSRELADELQRIEAEEHKLFFSELDRAREA